jgi:hypothetical protein
MLTASNDDPVREAKMASRKGTLMNCGYGTGKK